MRISFYRSNKTIHWTTFDPLNFINDLPDFAKKNLDTSKMDSMLAEVWKFLVLAMVYTSSGGVGTGGGARAPPNFFKGLKVPFFVMKRALFCDEKCPFL